MCLTLWTVLHSAAAVSLTAGVAVVPSVDLHGLSKACVPCLPYDDISVESHMLLVEHQLVMIHVWPTIMLIGGQTIMLNVTDVALAQCTTGAALAVLHQFVCTVSNGNICTQRAASTRIKSDTITP